LFCKIAEGEVPSHKVYEDDEHLAFLDIFPNREGQTLVIPKRHFSGYAFLMPDKEYSQLLLKAKKVARLLDKKLGAERTCLVTEGYGVDHAHVKLFPMKPGAYEGALTTKLGPRASDEGLEKTAARIRGG